MAIAIALPGFNYNDYGSSVTSILLLIDHVLYRFFAIIGNMKKIYRLKLNFVKTLVAFATVYVTDSSTKYD